MKEHREQSPKPFFLQTFLSLFYLLHNSISKELFGKALKCKETRSKKKKEKEIEQKKVGGKSLDSRDGGLKQDKQDRQRKPWIGKLDGDLSFTLSVFSPIAHEDRMADVPPPPPLRPTQNKRLESVWNAPPPQHKENIIESV